MTQTLLCGKWLITVITSIWFFSCMSSNMITQHLLCAKRLTTVVTSICFLTCISSNMLTQTLLCGKWLITVVTVGRSPSVSLPESLLHMYLTQESWHAGLRPLWSWLLIPYSLFNYLFKLVAFRPKCDIHVYERFPKQVSFLVYYKNSIFHILKTVFWPYFSKKYNNAPF